MWKKIGLGVILVGVIGILVAGAVIRTLDRTAGVAEARGNGARGDGQCASEAGNGAWGQAGNGGRGQGTAAGVGYAAGTGLADVEEWVTLQGTVTSVDSYALVVQAQEEVIVDGRAWSFAQDAGFSARVGDRLTLIGFYEDGEFKVGQIADASSGQSVMLRDENGRPLWAGRGWRSG